MNIEANSLETLSLLSGCLSASMEVQSSSIRRFIEASKFQVNHSVNWRSVSIQCPSSFDRLRVTILTMFLVRSLVLLIAVGLVLGEVVNFKPCKNTSGNCVVHEVRIDPCPQASENKACRIKRRKPASISFDFTPGFDSETATSSVYWARENEDLELEDMDHNSCNYSKCPYKSNEKNTLDFELPIRSKFPLNDYEIKWRLKGTGSEECCFTTSIKIVR